MIRAFLAGLTLLLVTPPLVLLVLGAAALGVRDVPGGAYDWASRMFCKALNAAAGVHIVEHGRDHVTDGRAHVLAMNHVSWYDVFTLASVLPHYKFVAKAELQRIPIFGAGATAWGVIWVERENRKQAFQSYEAAAVRIRDGVNVVVAPEGTRGPSYALRPFKKGPFVLAIAAQVPVIPVVVHGTREVMGRDSWRVAPGTVHLHYLPPIPTTGMTYADRDRLADACYRAMADCLEREYGISSPALAPATRAPRVGATTS
ncbi:MAG: lysophospholipid acyltransferase family protein [Gemmatimonadota bacterium]|nr:1-acyl-sn-glycerol-3-phosphate acyltransferase [Gemmatimonadota bacterium]